MWVQVPPCPQGVELSNYLVKHDQRGILHLCHPPKEFRGEVFPICGARVTLGSGHQTMDVDEALRATTCVGCNKELAPYIEVIDKDHLIVLKPTRHDEVIAQCDYPFEYTAIVTEAWHAVHYLKFFFRKRRVGELAWLPRDSDGDVCTYVIETHVGGDGRVCQNLMELEGPNAWTLYAGTGQLGEGNVFDFEKITFSSSLVCANRSTCGLHGWIKQGRWDELSAQKWCHIRAKMLGIPIPDPPKNKRLRSGYGVPY